MKLEKANFFPRKLYKNLVPFVEEFIAMETHCAKVLFNDREYKNVKSAYAAIHATLQRMNVNGIEARVREDNLYLINNLIEEE